MCLFILEIYSKNLQSQLFLTQKVLHAVYEDLREEKLYGVYHGEFNLLFSLIRQKNLLFRPDIPKSFDLNYVGIVAPLLDTLSHAFHPNCYIDGVYN